MFGEVLIGTPHLVDMHEVGVDAKASGTDPRSAGKVGPAVSEWAAMEHV
jgi:hypothetical protein